MWANHYLAPHKIFTLKTRKNNPYLQFEHVVTLYKTVILDFDNFVLIHISRKIKFGRNKNRKVTKMIIEIVKFLELLLGSLKSTEKILVLARKNIQEKLRINIF